MTLLSQWSPVTQEIGFIQSPLDRVVGGFLDWHRSIGIRYERTEIASSLKYALESLLPLSSSRQRKLLLPTRGSWVAFLDNGFQGSDSFSVMSQLAQRLDTLAVRVRATPEGVQHAAMIWEVFAPQHLGGDPVSGCRRTVWAAFDGEAWQFKQSGQPFDFERTDLYRKRPIRNRLTDDMLRAYLGALGIALVDDFFVVGPYSPAVRLQEVGAQSSAPEFSLDEVLAGMPWTADSQCDCAADVVPLGGADDSDLL